MASYARNRSRRGRKIKQQTIGAFRPALELAENPNSAHRGAARLADGSCTDIRTAEREYRPLTVATPFRDSRGRRNPRMGSSSYTV